VQRYPAFDPPEYVDWSPDPEVMRRFRATIEGDFRRRDCIERLTAERLVALYAGMVRFRLHDIFLKRWVRQGVISKAWLGTGEEATTVGPVHALDRSGAEGDVVGPMIRNAGACHEMGMSVADMFRGYLATADSPNRGRDLHIGGREYGVITPVSLVGSLAPVIAGLGLAFRLQESKRLALTWVGDGATKTGEVHEAFNPMPPRVGRSKSVVRAPALSCSPPRRSAWAVMRRTTKARRGNCSPPRSSLSGDAAIRSAATRHGLWRGRST
jgi:hypothetical protein